MLTRTSLQCYTGDLANTKKPSKYNLEYYLNFAQELVDCGIHVLAIKDVRCPTSTVHLMTNSLVILSSDGWYPKARGCDHVSTSNA